MALQVDVRTAIKNKNPKLAQHIPEFVIRWIERLIHQDEMNVFLDKHSEDEPIVFAQSLCQFFDVKLNVINEERFPKTGRYIIVSNHPLGALDGVSLIAYAGQYRSDIHFPVNDLLMYIKPLKGVFVPINKHGRNGSDFVSQLDAAFASDGLICYFPAGICSRKQKGKICDLDWKKTIIAKARQFGRDIIPVYFDAKNSDRFYRISNLRKKLGFKFNFEMLLLPDEMFRQQGNTFTLTIGEPIPHTTFDKNEKKDVEWAAWLKEKVYSLNQ